MAPTIAVKTSEISENASRDLLRLLEGVRGKKNLVLEKSIAGPLGLLVKFSTLQEYGVDKPFFLENDNVDSSQRNVVFLARGEKAKTVLAIADQIKRLRRHSQSEHEFSIFWVPRRTLVSDQLLEEAGVLGEVNIAEYHLHFVPLVDDLISLELEHGFEDLYLHKDPTPIFLAAKALMLMQQKYGLFPRILGKGDNAKRLADLLLRMRSEASAGGDAASNGTLNLDVSPSSSIESLIIIDREIDFPTVLLTQLTYEGLLDEVFSISSNAIEVPSSIVGAAPSQPQQSTQNSGNPTTPPPQQPLKRKIMLDSSEALYTTLRDSNFAIVGNLLNRVARRLQISYDKRDIANKTTSELRDFVSKLPGYQAEQASLKLHTALAEEIIKHTKSDFFTRSLEVQQNLAAGSSAGSMHENVDELISRNAPLATVLRLLCLESCLGGGIRARSLETLKRAILLAYGHQHLLTLSNLEKTGLLYATGSSSSSATNGHPPTPTNYALARKLLRIIVDEVNETEPDDVAYVFSGYAPLSVRLVQAVLQKKILATLTSANPASAAAAAASSPAQGFRPFDEAVKSVRGAVVDVVQSGEERAARARLSLAGQGGVGAVGKTVVVFFLGGVTRAEVSALRFVGKKVTEGRKILVATTEIVTGDRIVGALMEKGRFGSD